MRARLAISCIFCIFCIVCIAAASCSSSQINYAPEEDQPLEGLVTAKPAAFTPEDDLTPSISKNGRYLAFASEQNGNLDIWVRDYGTNSTYPITDSSAEDFDPAISPLGDRIAFVSRSDDAKGDIFITAIATAAAKDKSLTDSTTADRQPTWSPDAKTLYFTASYGIGLESIHAIDLESRETRRISPTPGFDPAPSPDGKYLVYTAARGVDSKPYPHLVALRLADSATRALSRAETPEGFARFVPNKHHALVYVRFADDDNGDQTIDGNDLASLWSLSIDLDKVFASSAALNTIEPFPLSDGRSNDLFPEPTETSIYFTQGDRQQDIMRIPLGGIFPAYDDPAKYFALADSVGDLRTRWFVYRCALAKTEPASLFHAQALLRIGNIHLEKNRADLARGAFAALVETTHTVNASTPEAELLGIARVELLAIDRATELAKASSPVDRERVLRATQSALEELEDTFAWTPRVKARVALELAEVIVERGDRPRALDALDQVVQEYSAQPFSAARAMLRQIELLGIAHDPDALGEAYARVVKRFPEQREAVRAASERIVRVQLEGLGAGATWRQQVDALSRLIPRYGDSPVRSAARWMLVEVLTDKGALDDAALQLERLVTEAGDDRSSAAKALERLARVDEDRGRLDRALENWAKLKANYGDVPGAAIEAREAITRVGTQKAALEEARGDKEAARAAYASIIENDLSQVKAHRRYLALSSETHHIEQAIDDARGRAERSPLTPMARYAYGLALTWKNPPALDDAFEEIEEALKLNPRFIHAYITRGWIWEMRELQRLGLIEGIGRALIRGMNTAFGSLFPLVLTEVDPLELALDDYTRALQLNPEADDPDTELEIKLNEANAAYRLGDKTSDVNAFKRALGRYVELMNADFHFPSPRAELVFFERLGRAAAWSEEWALSTMATRRAIDIAKRIDQKDRLGQLYGTLSLAYDQAGEDAYAREALASSEKELEQQELKTKLLLAKRNRAASKLETISERTPEMLESALEDLRDARKLGAEVDLEHHGLPMWVATTNDPSSAQYGFGPPAELDVNLALAGALHRAQGEESRAQAIAERRKEATEKIIDDVPKKYFVLTAEPVTLLTYRERFAIALSAARVRIAAGDRVKAEEILADEDEELTKLINSDNFARDRPALLADRGRLIAFRAEQRALELGAGATVGLIDADLERELALMIDAIEIGSKPVDTSTNTTVVPEDPRLAALSRTLSSTGAFAATATVALSPPILTDVARDSRAVRARLHHARALLGLARAAAQTRAASGSGLKALLGALDNERIALSTARDQFELAVREAAAAGPGLGARVLGMSLAESADMSRALGDRKPALVAEAEQLAKRVGDQEISMGVRCARALDGTPADLEAATASIAASMPQALANILPLATRVLTRSASIAVGRGELARALTLVDRAMLLQGAARPGVSLEHAVEPQDRELGRAARVAFASHDQKAIAALRDAPGSDAAKARIFAEPLLLDLIVENIHAEEALLVPVPLEGALGLFLVDGSTTAESADARMHFEVSALSPRELMQKVADARSALASGNAYDTTAIEKALLAPFKKQLARARTLFIADALIGGPVPALTTVLAHVSAPTALAVSRSMQLAGVEGDVAVAQKSREPLIETQQRLEGDAALAFKRSKAPEEASAEKKQRALDQRTTAEKLEERALALVVIEAPLHLEPAALERSAIALETEADNLEDADAYEDALAREPDRFERELPLEALDVPAETLVLGNIMDTPPAPLPMKVPPAETLRLDLVLGLRGQATLIAVPSAVPRDVAKRVLSKMIALAPKQGTAAALASAIKDAASPQAALITLIGSPGLDERESKAFALAEQKKAMVRSLAQLKKQDFAEAAVAIPHWIRLMRASGETKQLEAAYGALVGILSERLMQPARAADEQAELVAYLASKPKADDPKLARDAEIALAAARVNLGRMQGLAGDWDAAESTLEAAHGELTRLGDTLGAARATFELARHFELNRSDFKRAAALYEEAIAAYENKKAFEKKPPPEEAMRAVRSSGAIYLNRLSDPVRAKAAYERAYRYAQSEDERGSIIVDLARVARRSGDFGAASERAEQARTLAVKSKKTELEISAVTEEANVAWYQGDYRRGQDLCAKSLELIDALKTDKPSAARLKRRRRIYALSVCGLLAMSRREFSTAKDHLEHARRLAESIHDQSEIATQYNNLGRVLLEFGRVDGAIDAFRRAQEIDAMLKDRFALAYDLRNLGTALFYKGELVTAKQTLERGLEHATAVQDANNELRARFTLGELARAMKDLAGAKRSYAAALPIAESLEVKEIAWQIHRALGLMLRDEGKLEAAEAELWSAVKIVRSITGRAAATDFGPQRYAAFDDLIALLLERQRVAEAFGVADLARRLEQTELLDDSRITFASKDVPALLRDAREARTATTADAAIAALEKIEPHLARMLRPANVQELAPRVPKDAAVIMYRVTDDALIAFVVDQSGVHARVAAIPAKELADRIREYGRRLTARADLYGTNNALADVLIDPLKDLVSTKQRLAIVPHRLIRYVAFAALPMGSGSKEAIIDHLAVVSALDLESAVRALVTPLGALGDTPIIAVGAPSSSALESTLPFAKKELEMISEEHPSAEVLSGEAVTRAALLSAFSRGAGVVHFAGHSRLGASAEGRASFVDPLGGELRAIDGGVTMFDVLSTKMKSELVVLSACSSMLARTTPSSESTVSGDEMLSLAQSFAIAGAENVLATTMHVSDIAAAMMMKRFYRESRTQDAARALRSAQLVVRKHFPHAAWWATYGLLAGS